MALDVAAARAAVTEAALARDRRELLAVADSLPILTAFAYERHRARAYAHALRGARGSALAELCLGVASCAPSSRTLAADSAHLHLLLGDPERALSTLRSAAADIPSHGLAGAAAMLRRSAASAQLGLATAFETVTDRVLVRVLVSGAALGAALAALVALPDVAFDDRSRGAAGVTGPARSAPAGRVVADVPSPAPDGLPGGRVVPRSAAQSPEATLVRATPLKSSGSESDPRTPPERSESAPAASRRGPSPAPAAPSVPSTPPEPTPTPSPPASTSAPAPSGAAAAPVALTRPADPKGKGVGKAQAPGQVKKRTALDPAGPNASAATPPSEPPPADTAAGQGHDNRHEGKDKEEKPARGPKP